MGPRPRIQRDGIRYIENIEPAEPGILNISMCFSPTPATALAIHHEWKNLSKATHKQSYHTEKKGRQRYTPVFTKMCAVHGLRPVHICSRNLKILAVHKPTALPPAAERASGQCASQLQPLQQRQRDGQTLVWSPGQRTLSDLEEAVQQTAKQSCPICVGESMQECRVHRQALWHACQPSVCERRSGACEQSLQVS